MTGLVMSDLKRHQRNIDGEFKAWLNLATTMAQSVDGQPSVFRVAIGWSKSNVENDGPKSYYKRAVAVPFLDDINSRQITRWKSHRYMWCVARFGTICTI